MVYPELCPTNADFSSFLANKGREWTEISLVPWNAVREDRTFIAVNAHGGQAGWGTPFDVKSRPDAGQAMTVLKLHFMPVLVRIPDLDAQILMIHRNTAR